MIIDTSSYSPRISEPISKVIDKPQEEENTGEKGKSFSELMSVVMSATTDSSKQLSQESKELTAQLITGELDNLVDMQIAGQKSTLAFELNLTVRNKVLDAYQEVIKMNV